MKRRGEPHPQFALRTAGPAPAGIAGYGLRSTNRDRLSRERIRLDLRGTAGARAWEPRVAPPKVNP
jgi:hypothetical protein